MVISYFGFFVWQMSQFVKVLFALMLLRNEHDRDRLLFLLLVKTCRNAIPCIFGNSIRKAAPQKPLWFQLHILLLYSNAAKYTTDLPLSCTKGNRVLKRK